MKKLLLTGDEAIARGAYEAGVTFASAYPGTPSTEILENVAKYNEIVSEWAPNEKVALEAAAGASIGGARSLAAMKHVGVNVAADPLFTFSYTGVGGGLVLISADEPGMHSSQNEQDNRWYAISAKLPMFEPSDSQECIDMLKTAYDLSEEYDTPVLMRVTTRICHSKSIITPNERQNVPIKEYKKNIQKYVAVPAIAARRRLVVEERMAKLALYTESTPHNRIEPGGRIGVIASGMCYNYAREVFGDDATYLKLGYTNPLPNGLLAKFAEQVDTIYIIEENDPYIQNWVERLGYKAIGKPIVPPYGEMTADVLRKALADNLGTSQLPTISYDEALVVPRPPVLCSGCPHRGFFYELAKKKDTVVAGDIGCYSLGFAEPFNGIDYIVCMGAAFSSGHGTRKALAAAGKSTRVVGVMGDSTFFHMGINGLIEVLYNNSDTICVILDNRSTGMTGHQEHPGTGRDIRRNAAHEIDIETTCKALGAKHVTTIDPNDLKAVRKALNEAYERTEPSVIITRWPCVLKPMSQEDYNEFGEDLFKTKYKVDPDACISCRACIRAGCPSTSMDEVTGKMVIDSLSCVGCSVCAQICPPKIAAISKEGGS
ncbi:MAG: indolepyruvate ferredoxin oxidoreductase subunit alpha [Defluviitaleaceae bacterium]|nr:indolepyruvate ferredoxin oxidoreductase subunit alpha [Defluviitaleaceae bacterium]